LQGSIAGDQLSIAVSAWFAKKLSHKGLFQSEDRKNSLCGFCFFLPAFSNERA
jgi:hypothetical protein